jgi:hypothetical protein
MRSLGQGKYRYITVILPLLGCRMVLSPSETLRIPRLRFHAGHSSQYLAIFVSFQPMRCEARQEGIKVLLANQASDRWPRGGKTPEGTDTTLCTWRS